MDRDLLHPIDFHEHWWYSRPSSGVSEFGVCADKVFDLRVVVKKRGRPKRSKKKSKVPDIGRGSTLETWQDPSSFEHLVALTAMLSTPLPPEVVIVLGTQLVIATSRPLRLLVLTTTQLVL